MISEQGLVGVVNGGDAPSTKYPALALRVLADIAMRALSPAVNDPTTAVQAFDHVDALLRVIVRRELDVGTIRDADGELRAQLRPASWEDYMSVALDETVDASGSQTQVRRRSDRLLNELLAVAPAGRRPSLQNRLDRTRGA